MAKKADTTFDLSKMIEGFWGAYDPDKIREVFDPQKFMEQMQAMMPGGVGLGDAMDRGRRGFEAMAEANKAAAEAYRSMMKKQMDIFERMTAAAREYATELQAAGGAEAARQAADANARAVERSLALMKEVAEATREASEKAYKDTEQRLATAMEEFKRG